uniref:Hyaluronidase n=1 Tax=Eptatretus burgeri TaxID=7764 RepID=A0A8C4QIB3_EPTBU
MMELFLLITVFISSFSLISSTKTIEPPFIPGKLLITAWNAPSHLCDISFKIKVDVSIFDYVGFPSGHLKNQDIMLFYESQLGIYPHIDSEGNAIHGGVPQLGDLRTHLKKAEEDIQKLIPSDSSRLCIIDWEAWRPLWRRNWGSLSIYKQMSEKFVQENLTNIYPTWKIKTIAEKQFENAAKNFMLRTLQLGQRLKPKCLWGFYLFPNCYNYEYKKENFLYTGRCPKIEPSRNDLLQWMWHESDALYPSIYVELMLKDSPKTVPYVRYRLDESIRVASPPLTEKTKYIFPYVMPVYTETDTFLTESDLIAMVGEPVSLGIDGCIFWTSSQVTVKKDSCLAMRDYMDNVLQPYLTNLTTAAQLCSTILCSGKGRCVRKEHTAPIYLHLPRSFNITPSYEVGEPPKVTGCLLEADARQMRDDFFCKCWEPDCENFSEEQHCIT